LDEGAIGKIDPSWDAPHGIRVVAFWDAAAIDRGWADVHRVVSGGAYCGCRSSGGSYFGRNAPVFIKIVFSSRFRRLFSREERRDGTYAP
jgi:hypothetical protein